MRVLTDYFATLVPPVDCLATATSVGMPASYARAVDNGTRSLLASYRRALASAAGCDETEIARRVATLDPRTALVNGAPMGGGYSESYRKQRVYSGEPLVVDYRQPPASTIASPLDVANCQLWLTADTGVTSAGGAVSAWANQGLAGGSFTAVTTPTLIANGVNGKAAVCAVSGNVSMTSTKLWTDIATASAWTAFALVRFQDPAGDINATSATNAPVLTELNGKIAVGFVGQVNGAPEMTAGVLANDGADKSTRATVQAHRTVLLTSRLSAGVLSLWVNMDTPVTTSSVGATVATSTLRLFQSASRYLKARVRHLAVYNRALTDVETLRVQRYLAVDGGV